jgi:hypothetical protein
MPVPGKGAVAEAEDRGLLWQAHAMGLCASPVLAGRLNSVPSVAAEGAAEDWGRLGVKQAHVVDMEKQLQTEQAAQLACSRSAIQ